MRKMCQSQQFVTWAWDAGMQTSVTWKIKAQIKAIIQAPGGGVLPYKGLMGKCGQPGYVFRDFCLKQGIEFIRVSIFQFLS